MKRKKFTVAITLILIILLAFFIYKNISIEKNQQDEYQDYTPQEEISEEQTRQTKVTLYFANIETGELETEIKPHLNLTIKRKGYSFSPKKKLLRTNTMSISNNQCSIDNTNYLDVISPEEQHFMKVASSKHNNKVI